MNILTFDTEEWFLEKEYCTGRSSRYQTFDRYLKSILDLLAEQNKKATFFCVGGLAQYFPEVVKSISERGHEIGCHSNTHVWLSTLDREQLKNDTLTALHSLEDVVGKKVVSYRAPAFSIGEQNKWALEVLAECGIERDASIYPAVRDFGGFANFPADKPSVIKIGSATLKEFPISLTMIAGKQLAYSGGGYFRFLPFWLINKIAQKQDYMITYFHIADLEYVKMYLDTKEYFETYFKQPATLKNRTVRMFKRSVGTKGAFDKMCRLVRTFDFVNLEEADSMIEWNKTNTISL